MERPKGQHLRNKNNSGFAQHHLGRNVGVLIGITNNSDQAAREDMSIRLNQIVFDGKKKSHNTYILSNTIVTPKVYNTKIIVMSGCF
jgi:hypothetical protein